MRLKASPAALVAALTEANARLRWEEWGRSRSPAGETAIPFLSTRELRAKLSKAHRRSERAAEIEFYREPGSWRRLVMSVRV